MEPAGVESAPSALFAEWTKHIDSDGSPSHFVRSYYKKVSLETTSLERRFKERHVVHFYFYIILIKNIAILITINNWVTNDFILRDNMSSQIKFTYRDNGILTTVFKSPIVFREKAQPNPYTKGYK